MQSQDTIGEWVVPAPSCPHIPSSLTLITPCMHNKSLYSSYHQRTSLLFGKILLHIDLIRSLFHMLACFPFVLDLLLSILITPFTLAACACCCTSLHPLHACACSRASRYNLSQTPFLLPCRFIAGKSLFLLISLPLFPTTYLMCRVLVPTYKNPIA